MNDFNKKRFFVTLFSALAVGLFAHLFGMVNVIDSVDSMISTRSTGAGITSGRWMLEILNNYVDRLWPMWNIGFFNNALAIFILGLCAWLMLLILDIRDLYLCALFGGVFLCFPSVASTFLFSQATVHYAIALFLSVYSVYLCDRHKWGFLPASLLSAVSLGIYQAYFPFAAGLYLSLLVMRALQRDSNASKLLKQAFIYLGTLLLALAEYFIILKLMLHFSGNELSGYQGIDNMGKFALSEIPALILSPYFSFFKMFFVKESGAVNSAPVQHALLLLGLICAGIIIYIVIKDRRRIFRQDKGILLLFLLLYPAAVYSIRIMCFHSEIHFIMIYAAVLIYLLPLILLKHFKVCAEGEKEKKACRILRSASIVLISVIILNFSLQANIIYRREYTVKAHTESYCNTLLTRIQSLEGYRDDMKWVIYGRPDNDFIDPYAESGIYAVGSGARFIGNYKLCLERDLGYSIPYADEYDYFNYQMTDLVQNMPLYPDDGSICIHDGRIIIKFQETP